MSGLASMLRDLPKVLAAVFPCLAGGFGEVIIIISLKNKEHLTIFIFHGGLKSII